MQKIYTPQEMPNEEYHDKNGALKDYISGTGLSIIYHQSLAHYKYADETSSPVLHFGIASHAAYLEPDLFDAEFIRGIKKEEHEGILTSDASMKSLLKELGIPKYSTKKGQELIDMIDLAFKDTPENKPKILSVMNSELEATGKAIVNADDYDNIMQMRRVLLANSVIADALQDIKVEHTFITEIEGVKVKVRPDILTHNNEVWDYKTSTTAKPDEFIVKAYKLGYFLKMALITDVVAKVTGNSVNRTVLLAQEKKSPFVTKPIALTSEQLEIGRKQYKKALRLYREAIERNIYPAYGNSISSAVLPDWILREEGML